MPAAQLVHASTVETVEYLPVRHFVQMLAPILAPVFVMVPAGHSEHDVSVDAAEYWPAAHTVHVFAPAAEPVSVIEPGAHREQYDLPLPD